MRIDNITISNFRGFHAERSISIPANVVILRGPNGSGKTSLLDAIQWLLLGEVPRLRPNMLKKDEDYLSNRYASGPPFVEANLSGSEGMAVRVTRRGVGKSMQIQVDRPDQAGLVGEPAQQWVDGAMNSGLTGLSKVDLIRRHLLQQDDMREFLGADTKERYEFIAALSGMERLTNLEAQMKDELKAARKSVKELEAELQQASSELEAVRGSVAAAREAAASREPDPAVGEARARARELLDLDSGDDALASLRERSSAIGEGLEKIGELARGERRARERLQDLPADPRERIAELSEECEQLSTTEERLGLDLVNLEAALADAKVAADRTQQLAALALEQIDGPCPVCGQEHDLEKTRAHLNSLLESAPGLSDLSEMVEAKRAELNEARMHRAGIEADASRLRTAAEERRRTEDSLDQVREEAAVARESLLSSLPDRSAAKGDSAGLAETFKMQIDELAARLQRAADSEARSRQVQRRVDALNERRASSERRDADLRQALAAQEETVERAEEARSALGARSTAVMREVANSTTGLINEIYTRLDVHPTFREFGFHTQRYFEAGHLRPWVYDRRREKDGNALHVLSAAQLNSLAICLFLALNLEREAELRTAILDDPVQSLDDVNLLSLTDVLRTVRRHRQVIVSTHDETLAELLIRKLRPLRDSDATAVVALDRWSESGPRVASEMRSSSGMEPEFQLLEDATA